MNQFILILTALMSAALAQNAERPMHKVDDACPIINDGTIRHSEDSATVQMRVSEEVRRQMLQGFTLNKINVKDDKRTCTYIYIGPLSSTAADQQSWTDQVAVWDRTELPVYRSYFEAPTLPCDAQTTTLTDLWRRDIEKLNSEGFQLRGLLGPDNWNACAFAFVRQLAQ